LLLEVGIESLDPLNSCPDLVEQYSDSSVRQLDSDLSHKHLNSDSTPARLGFESCPLKVGLGSRHAGLLTPENEYSPHLYLLSVASANSWWTKESEEYNKGDAATNSSYI